MSSRCSWCPVVVLKLGECWWSPWRLQHPSPRSFFSPRIDTVSTCIMKIRVEYLFLSFGFVMFLFLSFLFCGFLFWSFCCHYFFFVHFLVVFSSGAGGWIRSRPGKSKSVIMHASQFFVIFFRHLLFFFCRYFFHFPVTTQRQQNDNKMTTLIRLIQNCKPEWQKHDNKMAKYLF